MEKSRAVFRDSSVEYTQKLMKTTWRTLLRSFLRLSQHFFATFSRSKRMILSLERLSRGICIFFSIICIFSRRKLAKVAHYFELTVPLVDSIHDIWATYLFVSSKWAHTFDRPPIEKRKQIALTVWALADQGTCRRSMSNRKLLAFRAGPRELSGPTS